MTPRIRFEGLCKRFGGTAALDDVSFEVGAGRVHALVGENGAGKSTLMKILAGATAPTSGRMLLDGEAFAPRDPREAARRGIAIVYQELSIVPHLTVAENVWLGRWPRGRTGITVDRAAMHARTRGLFEKLGIDAPAGALAGELGVARQQLVEIARALSLEARVLVLDEPSAVLGPPEAARLLALVRALAARGVSVVYISHRIEEVLGVADEVTVLRDGRHVSTRPGSAVTRESLLRDMVGRELGGSFPHRAAPPGEAVLRVRGLSSGGRFEGVTFEVRAGEVFGLAGLGGSGRSSVAHALFGAAPVTAGTFAVGDRRGPFASPREAIGAGVALVPEDRQRQGLLAHRSVRENLFLASSAHDSGRVLLHPREERREAAAAMARCRVKAAGTEAAMTTLSGGNQQKTLFARWTRRPVKLLILDEPTRGVDVGAREEIYALLNAMAAGGTAVLVVSSDLPEVIGLCDRVGVMCRGSLAGVLDRARGEVSQEAVMRLATGAAAA